MLLSDFTAAVEAAEEDADRGENVWRNRVLPEFEKRLHKARGTELRGKGGRPRERQELGERQKD
jgi:hypothetical protein